METKVIITQSFHRYVSGDDGRPERRERIAQSQTVTVDADVAADWIAKGLAKPVAAPVEPEPVRSFTPRSSKPST